LTDLVRWLDDRRPAAPAALRQAMVDAVRQGDPGAGSMAERLAAAGLDALARVATQPSTRDRAVELLAADALLTYACEAAVGADAAPDAAPEARPNALDRLVAALDLRRFAHLLEEVER
jgi:hypothetical protein